MNCGKLYWDGFANNHCWVEKECQCSAGKLLWTRECGHANVASLPCITRRLICLRNYALQIMLGWTIVRCCCGACGSSKVLPPPVTQGLAERTRETTRRLYHDGIQAGISAARMVELASAALGRDHVRTQPNPSLGGDSTLANGRRHRRWMALATAMALVAVVLSPAAKLQASIQFRLFMLEARQLHEWEWIYEIECLLANPSGSSSSSKNVAARELAVGPRCQHCAVPHVAGDSLTPCRRVGMHARVCVRVCVSVCGCEC
jgi:hypothetical protein